MFEYTKQIRAKGWLSKEVAELWEYTPNGLSKIARNPRPLHISALAGLEDRVKVGRTPSPPPDRVGDMPHPPN